AGAFTPFARARAGRSHWNFAAILPSVSPLATVCVRTGLARAAAGRGAATGALGVVATTLASAAATGTTPPTATLPVKLAALGRTIAALRSAVISVRARSARGPLTQLRAYRPAMRVVAL